MPDSQGEAAARDLLVGRRITAVCFIGDFIEIHFDEVILTGYTKPVGIVNDSGPSPATLPALIGSTVHAFTVEPEKLVAIDLGARGENRVAFPLDEGSRTGPEAVQLFMPAHFELDLPSALWVW